MNKSYVLHGENHTDSRRRLSELVLSFEEKGWEVNRVDWHNINQSQLLGLCRSQGLLSFGISLVIENFFTGEFIHQEKLYIWEEIHVPDSREVVDVIVEDDPEAIRQILKNRHTLYGVPLITVEDGNYDRNGKLYLKHHYSGFELDPRFESGAIEHIYYLWDRDIHLETIEVEEDESEYGFVPTHPILHFYDGKKHVIKKIG